MGWYARIEVFEEGQSRRGIFRKKGRIIEGYITGWTTSSDGRSTIEVDGRFIERFRFDSGIIPKLPELSKEERKSINEAYDYDGR